MAEAYKNQHIVPQAYLNRFAKHKGNKYIIGTRLKAKSSGAVKFFPRAVSDVAYRENYYDTTEQDDPKHWEHFLDKTFDRLCGRPLENLISRITLTPHDRFALTPEETNLLATIIFSQIVRVPSFLENQMRRVKSTASTYKFNLFSEMPNLSLHAKQLIESKFSSTDEIKNLVLEHSFDVTHFEKYCSVLKSRQWGVYFNSISNYLPFVTSDNPVLMLDAQGQAVNLTDLGLTSSQLFIFFPLSPSILVGVLPPHEKLKEVNGKRIILSKKHIKLIMDLNMNLIENSYIHSFLPEPLFSIAKETV